MKNLAALTAVLALATGLAACTSSGSSTATATATTTPVSGTETLSGKLTGPAAMSDILVFHLRLTGPVGTTATIRLGTEVPEKYELYTIHTAVGDLAVTLASAGTNTGGLKSAQTCLYVLTTAVPFTVDGAKSTGKFAGATGTGTAAVVTSGDDPKLSDGTCNTSRDALPSATTAVATFAATIKLTVRH
ncbi:MAG TPA: hypothetical protein VGS06_28180 [Streptosporangiaceae bacterium]|jgi:hypothetical protein|nr:hypothetical protein [Streptosporangiaceae bacterium]